MDFSEALKKLKKGNKLFRKNWNGKFQWLELQKPDKNSKMTLPYIYMVIYIPLNDDPFDQVPWIASQTDLLADDWNIAKECPEEK